MLVQRCFCDQIEGHLKQMMTSLNYQILTIMRKFVWLTTLPPLPVRALLFLLYPLTGVRSHVISTFLARDADIGSLERADEVTSLDLKSDQIVIRGICHNVCLCWTNSIRVAYWKSWREQIPSQNIILKMLPASIRGGRYRVKLVVFRPE